MSEDLTDLEPIDLAAAQPPPAPSYAWAPPPVRSPRNPKLPAIVAGVIGLCLVSGAVGYAIESSTHSNDNAAGQSPTTLPGSLTPVPGAADRAALSRLVVKQSDVGPTQVVLLIPDGNRTTQPTLDLCNGTFPSEDRRVARLQVAEVDPQGNASLSTEAVSYRNAAETVTAFEELRRVRANCPEGPVTSPVGGGTATTRFNAAPDGDWPRTPTVERQAYSLDTIADGETSPSIAVYLRRGRVLMGLYFPRPNGAQPPVEGKTSVEDIVAIFEARMARLPAGVVGGTSTD